MKNRILTSVLAFFAAAGLMLASCTKNDDTTIVPIGTEYYIDDIISVIPDSLQTSFLTQFGTIYEGAVPPKIEGGYMMDPKQRIGTNLEGWPLLVEPNPVKLKFNRQHNGIASMSFYEEVENEIDTVFICGNGTHFTVYFIEDKDFEVGWMRRGVILKGQKTEQGIADLRMAQIVMEVEASGIHIPAPVGSYYIFKDGNGLAENLDW